jgi:hypothetical protein
MKILSFSLVLLALIGCKSWSPSAIKIDKNPISVKLLTLENSVDELSKSTMYRTTGDDFRIFNQELEENLTDIYGVKYGYISYKTNIIDYKMGLGYYMLSCFLVTIPNLFGMPYMNFQYEVETEIRIFDKNKKLLAKYSANGKSRTLVAYYYGYQLKYAARKSYIEAIISGLHQIRPSIERDAASINEKLLEAGKL